MTKLFLLATMGYFVLSVVFALLMQVFVNGPYERKKAQEALLKASSTPQDGIWPPAPVIDTDPHDPEPWVWCLLCERASPMDALDENGGFCMYEDCSGDVRDLMAWCDLKRLLPELPDEPEVDVVYADLVRINTEEPGTFVLGTSSENNPAFPE